MNGRVLVVVEDARASRAVSEELVRRRFATDVCLGVRTALEKLRLRRYDAVVLDLALEPTEALRLSLELRPQTDAPIIALAREPARALAAPLVAGELGYPPLHDGLDLPRTREPGANDVLRFGDFVIDLAAMRASAGGETLDLTPTEFKLLVALGDRPGHVLSRDELLLRVWNYTDGNAGRLVDVHLGRLRKKLRSAGVEDLRVETARGFGYRLVPVAGSAAEPDALTSARP